MCSTYSDPDDPFYRGLSVTTNALNVFWGGRLEGIGGDVAIYQTDGHLFLTSYTEINHLENTADAVYFTGKGFNATSGVSLLGSISGNGYVVDVDRGYIGILHIGSGSGAIDDDISSIIGQASSSHRLVLPYENTVNGLANYPSDQWYGLACPDGWQKWRAGTTTVTSGTTTEVEAWAGDTSFGMRLTGLEFNTTPAGDARYQVVHGYDSGNDRHWVGIEETEGTDIDLEWKVHIRR